MVVVSVFVVGMVVVAIGGFFCLVASCLASSDHYHRTMGGNGPAVLVACPFMPYVGKIAIEAFFEKVNLLPPHGVWIAIYIVIGIAVIAGLISGLMVADAISRKNAQEKQDAESAI